MLSFTTQDAVVALKKSPNLNAALKSFLKREVRNGDPIGRFVKDMRELIDNPNTTRLEQFIGTSRPDTDPYLIAICSYAHHELVGAIISKVGEKYANDFNKTFSSDGQKLQILDQKSFDSISGAAIRMIDQELGGSVLGQNPFLKNAVLFSIFEKPVLEHILAKGL